MIAKYVVVEYCDEWWLAIVQDIEPNLKEFHFAFIHPRRPEQFSNILLYGAKWMLNYELLFVYCTNLLNSVHAAYSITQQQLTEIQHPFSEK